MNFDVYMITNTINDKKYIGITTVGVHKRWKNHLKEVISGKRKRAIHFAIKKYGINSFIINHIASSKNLEDLLDTEKALIKQHNTQVPNGYNLTAGGEGLFGYKFSPESIEKMRISHRGFKPKRESIEKTRIAITGKPKTPEHNKKVSDKKREWWANKDLSYKKSLAIKIRNGQNHHILNEERVSIIKLGILSGKKNREIAQDLGEDPNHIASIKCGRIWKDIPPHGFSEGIIYGGM
jgi:group I intron endonuclease